MVPHPQGREASAAGLSAGIWDKMAGTRWLRTAHRLCGILLATTNNDRVVNTQIGEMLIVCEQTKITKT